MGLISCPECGAQVSSNAPTCPHCGNPIAPTSPLTVTVKPDFWHDPNATALVLLGIFVVILACVWISFAMSSCSMS